MLQHQLHEYKSGFCFQRKYNLNSKLLSIEISHELEAEPSFIREKRTGNLLISVLNSNTKTFKYYKKKRLPAIFEEHINP